MNSKRSVFKETGECEKIETGSPGSIFSKASCIHSCLLPPPRVGLLAAIEAYKIPDGNPFPWEIPCTPFRWIPAPHFASFKMCNLHTSLAVPFQECYTVPTLRQKAYIKHLTPLAWSDLQFTQIVFWVLYRILTVFYKISQFFQVYSHFSRVSRILQMSGSPLLFVKSL